MIGKPDFDAEASEVYGEVLDALDGADIRYMLGGALALNAYTGIWRDTKDLDVFTTEKTGPRVLAVLEEAGCEPEVTAPVWGARARRQGSRRVHHGAAGAAGPRGARGGGFRDGGHGPSLVSQGAQGRAIRGRNPREPQRNRSGGRVVGRKRDGDFDPRSAGPRHPRGGVDPLEDLRGRKGPLRRG